MSDLLSLLDPKPAGFGRCGQCAYRETATPGICFSCASAKMEMLTEGGCDVCGLDLQDDHCGNPLCSFYDRYFDRNHAIAVKSGVIERAILRYKYDGVKGWAVIFARVLVGYLDSNPDRFGDVDLVVASPTFAGEGEAREWDHTGLVLDVANELAESRWPFDVTDPLTIIKTKATTPMAGKRWKERKAIAEGELRESLAIPNPARVRGKRILVYDDVFTDGFTLREIARCLLEDGGAVRVEGVTLVRQPFRKR